MMINIKTNVPFKAFEVLVCIIRTNKILLLSRDNWLHLVNLLYLCFDSLSLNN